MLRKIKVYNKTMGKCWYCGTKLNIRDKKLLCVIKDKDQYNNGNSSHNFSIDHVIPPSKGGTNNIENLVPCCKACNSAKSTRGIEEFREISWDRLFESKHGVRFTKNQKIFLKNKNFDFKLNKFEFYFEKQGLVTEGNLNER